MDIGAPSGRAIGGRCFVTYVFSCILWIVPRHFTQESFFQMGFCGEQLVSMGINNTPNGLCIPPVYWWFQFTGGFNNLSRQYVLKIFNF